MGSVLNGLKELQSVENRLRAVKAKLARCRRNVIVQENQVRTLQNVHEAKKEEIQLTKIQSNRLEMELGSRDESVAKLRASLNGAKTNKEYAAVLTQLNTTKADNSKLEAQILELMKAVEADEAELTKIQGQIDEQKRILEQTRKESEGMAAKYEHEMAEIQGQWELVARNVPADQLSVFKRIAETYDGEALAFIDKQEGKTDTFTCGGCFMGVPVESVNQLMTKDDVIRCPNCTRILVLGESQSS